MRLECLNLFSEFGNTRARCLAWLLGRAGQPGLELVAQAGQFSQVGVVQEGLAEAGLVVEDGKEDAARVRRGKVLISSGCDSHFSECKSRPASGSLQPVAIEATRGGNETVGAFETDGSLWRLSEPTGRNSQ